MARVFLTNHTIENRCKRRFAKNRTCSQTEITSKEINLYLDLFILENRSELNPWQRTPAFCSFQRAQCLTESFSTLTCLGLEPSLTPEYRVTSFSRLNEAFNFRSTPITHVGRVFNAWSRVFHQSRRMRLGIQSCRRRRAVPISTNDQVRLLDNLKWERNYMVKFMKGKKKVKKRNPVGKIEYVNRANFK